MQKGKGFKRLRRRGERALQQGLLLGGYDLLLFGRNIRVLIAGDAGSQLLWHLLLLQEGHPVRQRGQRQGLLLPCRLLQRQRAADRHAKRRGADC